MAEASQGPERQTEYPRSAGETAVLVITAIVFVAALAFEFALFAYTPKERPLQFYSSVVVPYKPFLVVWSLLTVLSGVALIAHRQLSKVLRQFSILRKLWGSMLLVVFSASVGIALTEVALRVYDPLGIQSFPTVLRFWEEMMIPDPELRYRLRPSASGFYGGVELETNSDGMRDDEPLPITPGTRILVLGDSVALGNQVAENEITFRLLEEMLGGRETIDVVNAGVSSYNTVQESRLLTRIGDKYEPDLVLLLYIDNDVEMDHELSFYPGEYWRQAVYLPRRIVQFSYVRHLIRLGVYAIFPDRPNSEFSLAESEGWKLSRAALSEISQWCDSRGIPFLVVFYPMLDPSTGNQYFELLADAGSEIGFPVVDSSTYWSDRPKSDMHLSLVDAHLNPLGHKLLAQGLNEELRRRYPSLVN